jgi:hypothetical protein
MVTAVNYKRDYAQESGGALVELSFVLPLLLLLVIGLFETSRLISEVGWINQVAYQTAKLGGETPESLGRPLMNHRANMLAQLQNNFVALESMELEPLYSEDGLVSARLSGEINSVVQGVPLRLSVRMVGPNLLRTSVLPGNLGEFANPSSICLQCYFKAPDVSVSDLPLSSDIGNFEQQLFAY